MKPATQGDGPAVGRPFRRGLQSEVRWLLNPARLVSQARFRRYRDKHQGQRCFIIGNGPSLKQMDLSPLKHEFTFGLNRIYLLFPTLGFATTYYVVVNRLVIEQCARDIEGLQMPKFVNWAARDLLQFTSDMMFVRDPYVDEELGFSKQPPRRIWEGFTVTYAALQIAYYMGFQQVVLIGVDHSFSTQGVPNATVVSSGADPNHFDPNYFGAGFRWQLPDLEGSERAYILARQTYAEAGRQILDATVGGKLQVFPKATYESLFS